MSYRSTI